MNNPIPCRFCTMDIHTAGHPLKVSYICQLTLKATDPIYCALCENIDKEGGFDLGNENL